MEDQLTGNLILFHCTDLIFYRNHPLSTVGYNKASSKKMVLILKRSISCHPQAEHSKILVFKKQQRETFSRNTRHQLAKLCHRNGIAPTVLQFTTIILGDHWIINVDLTIPHLLQEIF